MYGGWRGRGDTGCVYVHSRVWRKQSLLNPEHCLFSTQSPSQSVINPLLCLIREVMFFKEIGNVDDGAMKKPER